jgi:hypothetical protein
LDRIPGYQMTCFRYVQNSFDWFGQAVILAFGSMNQHTSKMAFVLREDEGVKSLNDHSKE